MRKILMSLLLASLSLMVQAQGRYVIDGTVNNAPEGASLSCFAIQATFLDLLRATR